MLTRECVNELMNAAKKAAENTHSPYSQFPVGAAVLTSDGDTFIGTNVENLSFGLTMCAERVAIGAAIAHGAKKIEALAVYSPKVNTTPCGACRQVIKEFADEHTVVLMDKGAAVVSVSIDQLLPDNPLIPGLQK